MSDSIYVVPDEHKEFVAEFANLLGKFPKAAARYKLADLGEHLASSGHTELKCVELGGFISCDIVHVPE